MQIWLQVKNERQVNFSVNKVIRFWAGTKLSCLIYETWFCACCWSILIKVKQVVFKQCIFKFLSNSDGWASNAPKHT